MTAAASFTVTTVIRNGRVITASDDDTADVLMQGLWCAPSARSWWSAPM